VDEVTDDAARADALARVRALLVELDCTVEEIDQAVEDDVIDLLVVDRMLLPSGRRMTQSELAARTQFPTELTRRFWRALGFLDVGDDEAAFTDMDVEAVELFRLMVAQDLVDLESAVQMARVIGSSMARIAEAETTPGSTPILVSSGDAILDADQFARRADTSIPAMARLLEYVWRRHLQAATRRAMLVRTRGADSEGIGPVTAVGFADMVGYTMLSQHLGDEELAAVVARFDEVAHDTVVALGGRAVKMIGDEVMFVVPSAPDAAEIGLGLAEAYAGDELLSDVRVGLAFGPVLVQDGDYYGPVVNLASRLVGVANPGTVLVSDEFRTALVDSESDGYRAKALRTRTLKDIGRVQAWKLTRAGGDPRLEQRRNLRWDRLTDAVRDLEARRARGGLTLRSSTAADGSDHGTAEEAEGGGPGSVGVEPGGGDPVGPELEGIDERGDRPSP
jgi:adenylate cyclase